MRETNPSNLSQELIQDFDLKNYPIHLAPRDSPVQEFYKDQTVFITGATGFLGTLLVEKLLRCCPGIRKLILLVRDRGLTSVEERVRDYFSEDVFDRMRLANRNYYEKVDIVCGQLDADNFGLSPNDQILLTSQTSVVFHVGATVRFDDHIRTAYNINVKGTETLLSLAKRMPHLKSFVYVSTAYCHCDRTDVEEIFYPPTFTAEELSIVINSSSEEEMAILNVHLLDKKPNTYTLTKAAAEDLVREVVHELPICVIRPSIVFPTLEEPMPLWMKGYNGAFTFVVLTGMGLLRVCLGDLDLVSDFVPADRTINALTVLAWYQTIPRSKLEDTKEISFASKEDTKKISYASKEDTKKISYASKEDTKKKSYASKEDTKDVLLPHRGDGKVFNYVSYNDNKISQREFQQTIDESFDTGGESCSKLLWKRHYYVTKSTNLFLVLFYVCHCIPALAFTFAEKLTHRKPLVMKIYRKIFFFFPTITYFSLHQWRFSNANTRSMVDAMSSQDRNRFDASLNDFRWESLLIYLGRSLAVYWLKEPLTKEHYQKRMVYIERVDFCVWAVVYVIAGYCGLVIAADQINFYCRWS